MAISYIRVDAIKKAARFLKNSEVYRAENIHVNFEKFDDIINETISKLINDCKYDNTASRNDDSRNVDSYNIVEIECESADSLVHSDENSFLNDRYKNAEYDIEKNNEGCNSDNSCYDIMDVECESVDSSVNDRNDESPINNIGTYREMKMLKK